MCMCPSFVLTRFSLVPRLQEINQNGYRVSDLFDVRESVLDIALQMLKP